MRVLGLKFNPKSKHLRLLSLTLLLLLTHTENALHARTGARIKRANQIELTHQLEAIAICPHFLSFTSEIHSLFSNTFIFLLRVYAPVR